MRISNRQIGYYAVKEEIGRGRNAVVHRAIDTRSTREVALKILLPENISKATYLYRFVKEGQNATRLEHPNIVRIFEAGEVDGFHYIALEHIKGDPLAKQLLGYGKSLTIAQSLPLIKQIASGLEYAHRLGFLHRDINLNNILITSDNRALISDFGMAHQLVADETTTIFTMADYSIGTPAFMAPEQARGDVNIDQRSDVYSLGAVAYRMLTGRLPFQAESQPALLYKIIYEAAPAPEIINPSIPPGIAYALKRVLSKDPPKRYRSAEAFVNALHEGQSWVPQSRKSAYSTVRPRPTTQHPNSPADMKVYPPPPRKKPSSFGWAVLPTLVGVTLVAITLILLLTWENRLRNQIDAITNARTTDTSNMTVQEVANTTEAGKVENIAVTVEADIVEEGEDNPEQAQTAIILNPFIAADGSFTINVPEGWRVSSKEDEIQFEAEDLFARVWVKRIEEQDAPDALERVAIQYIEENSPYQSTEPISGGFVEIGTLDGYEQKLKAMWLGRSVFLRIVAVNSLGQNYIIGTVAEEHQNEIFDDTFDAIFNGFRTKS